MDTGACGHCLVRRASGPALFMPAETNVVIERIDSRASDVGIPGQIELGVEIRIRFSELCGAMIDVVQDRVEPARGDIGILRQVPWPVELSAGSNSLPNPKALPPPSAGERSYEDY